MAPRYALSKVPDMRRHSRMRGKISHEAETIASGISSRTIDFVLSSWSELRVREQVAYGDRGDALGSQSPCGSPNGRLVQRLHYVALSIQALPISNVSSGGASALGR